AAAALFFAYQYFTSERFVNPETGRKSHVGMSEQQEVVLGLQTYQQVLAQSRTIDSGPELEMVKRVAGRLATATGKSGQGFDWKVSLIRDGKVNAFCLPGGKIVVYSGIIPVAQNEAALATVLGHEMAHATSRHGAQRLFQSQMSKTIMMGANASVALGDMDRRDKMMVMGAVGAGAQYGVILPFSRQHESEADE